ncbi:antibiotic biosynthesis monooxygenase (plasmid) [Streptomyces castrisilvae]|uniref:Antibiotic biosynthesis monooxygenase n=1 Tax=Streptomyces castrisilvae TaxID=3033811 RepID=A0ABY9HVB4_9ACTN|nr:antibiotic biosynthesis monooxygenase [Streptomyces sp. Mut1]WLQ38538.1 antibiotic biosynthesis monooxygenase [Streptomyces sp. Mut1]
MTRTRTQQAAAPVIDRGDAHAVFMTYWHVAGQEQGRAVLDEIADAWEEASRPADILSFSCYLSTGSDDFTAMTYAQCAHPDGYRPFIRALPTPAARVEPVEYRLHRSVPLAPGTGPAASVVIASFDVDGRERQEHIVSSVTENIEKSPRTDQRGLIASHFHLSVDGTRVINFAEWTSDEEHIAFLEGATRHRSLRLATRTPGVRPIGFTRYHLYRAIGS